jgi:hypothetical protein
MVAGPSLKIETTQGVRNTTVDQVPSVPGAATAALTVPARGNAGTFGMLAAASETQAAIVCNAAGDCHEINLRDPKDLPNELKEETDTVDDEDEKDDDDHYQEGRPGPLMGELLRTRLNSEVDPFTATGAVLALGMIGWTLYGYRPRRRQ